MRLSKYSQMARLGSCDYAFEVVELSWLVISDGIPVSFLILPAVEVVQGLLHSS